MRRAPRILLVDDDEDDYVLTRGLLVELFGDGVQLGWATTRGEAMTAIGRRAYDIYLIDFRLGADSGLDLIADAAAVGCGEPMVMLTGKGGRDVDLAAMRAGAVDYLAKGELTAPLLERTIRYAITHKEIEGRLAALARRDGLTGLANRGYFRERLEAAAAQARRGGHQVALILVDLDGFKRINDELGHAAGDLLLQEVAARLRGAVRSTDTAARLGGDEFALVLTHIEGCDGVETVVRKLGAAFERPFELERARVPVRGSMGIALFPANADNPEELLRHADLALYQAKREPGTAHRFYDAAMDARMAARRRRERVIRRGLAAGGFDLHFQPWFDLHDGGLRGAEALLRCPDAAGGEEEEEEPAGARELIAAAETAGLIEPVGEWVLREACRRLKSWRAAGLDTPAPVAVNVSALQLRRPGFAAAVAGILREHGVEPARLALEVAEGAALERADVVGENLAGVRRLGVRLVLDDFGTGWSCLRQLRGFGFDALKVDRSLVQGVGRSADDAAVARAIIALGGQLGLDVIAEGIETAPQLAFLKAQGCRRGQGFLLARPMPADAFARSWLARRA